MGTADTANTPQHGNVQDRDALTGLGSRSKLMSGFDGSEFEGCDVYVVLGDLDNFHMVNDTYGDAVGNEILSRVGAAVQASFGAKRTFRYGGDEFLIVNAFFDEDAFLEKIDSLNRQIDAISSGSAQPHLTCSYGYVYGRIETEDDLHEAIRLADRKMYEAKRLGKNRSVGLSLDADPYLSSGTNVQDKAYKSYEIDELTGLSNLIYFRNQLDFQLTEQREDGNVAPEDRIALVYFNIQNFKGYNQKFGIEAGDDLLMLIAQALMDAFPERLVSRFSADQFMAAAHVNEVEEGIKKVRQAFRRRQKDTSIWLKAGIYEPTDDDDNIGVSIDRAKLACDSIKGRRDVYFRYYDAELQSQIMLHRYVLEHFDRAVEEGWIKVFYQPIVRAATGEVCDVEALARWVDPKRDIVPPINFVPVLEEARLIHKLDLYIARRACSHLAYLQERDLHAVPVSLNLSRLDFELCDIVSEIIDIVDEFGISHDLVSIEVTESALSGNQEFLKDEIDRFRSAGFEVWMDDFGSGYSSLHLLKEYNFDLVKIDMGFLLGFETNESARVILAHIIGMANELGLKTLVEGVETELQRDFLRSIGCGRLQGYLFGTPISFDESRRQISRGEYPPLEMPDRHDFYEQVGAVNLLRPDPAGKLEGHYVPGDVPVAILRRHAGKYEYLNVSDVYRAFLGSLGLSGMDESAARLNDETRIEHIRMEAGVAECMKTGEWVWVEYFDNGKHCVLRVRCVADDPERDTVALLLIAVNVQESANITPVWKTGAQ